MKTEENRKAVMLSTAVYTILIRAYPKAFREKYGPEMAQVFREQCRDAATGANGFGLMKLWLRVLLDLVESGLREHIAALGGNMNMFKQALLGRLWLAPILAFLVAGVVTAGVCAYLMPKWYQSSVRVLVEKPAGKTSDLSMFDPYWIQTQFEAILSAPVLTQVIDKLSLSQRWAARYGSEAPLRKEDALRFLRNHLDIRQTRNTQMIEICVADESSKEAAEIANEIAAVYQRQVALQKRAQAQVVDLAEPGMRPIRPNIPLNTVVGGLLAAFTALLLVLILRLFRKRVAVVG